MNIDVLPDISLYRKMIPCPKCGSQYCIAATRRGPAIIGLSSKSFMPICLNCWHKARKGKTDRLALRNWNQQRDKIGLKSLRSKAGLSMRELSDLSHVSIGSISEYERGVHTPSLRTKQRLARALGVSSNEI